MDIVGLSTPTTTNRPGMSNFILLQEVSKFLTFGALETPVVDPGDEMRITGDHTFDVADGFVRWDTQDDMARLKAPVVGSRGSLGYKPELDLVFPGLTPDLLWTMVQNKDFIVLIPLFGCYSTQYLQLGDECNPVRWIPSDGFDTGLAGGNDFRGFKVKMSNNYSIYTYEGVVTMQP